MVIAEFKAWLDSFSAITPKRRSRAQQDRVNLRMGQIDGRKTTASAFASLYWPAPPWPAYPARGFAALDAMHALGKADAEQAPVR